MGTGWIAAFSFPETWEDLRDGAVQQEVREWLSVELRRELAIMHPLSAANWQIVARSVARDDVIVSLDDSTAGIVHLTYTPTPPESVPWPESVTFDSAEDLRFELNLRD